MIANGVEFGSLAFNFAFAHQVATIIADVILLAIAAIPIVGQIICLIINLFDTIVYFVCGLKGSEHPICKGLEGWLTEGIRWTIYSGNIMVTLSDDNRFQIKRFEQEFADPALGMSACKQHGDQHDCAQQPAPD